MTETVTTATIKAALTDTFEAPSKIARRAKAGTALIHSILDELVASGEAEVRGNGAWRNYRRAAASADRHVVVKTTREIETGIEVHTMAASPLPLADAERAMATLAKRIAPAGFMVEYRIRSARDPFVKALAA